MRIAFRIRVNNGDITMYISLEDAIKLSNEVANTAWNDLRRQTLRYGVLTERPTIIWKKKGFGAAGCYTYNRATGSSHIEMNINYLFSPDAKKFIVSTTKHELAHAATHQLFKTINHDSAFKLMCMFMGDDGERCHDYRTPENSTKKNFTCPCGTTFSLTPYRINKAKSGVYFCSKCKTNLKEFVK